MTFRSEDRPFVASGLMLGVGLGGFVDGILFHQIFQIHGMMTARRPPDTIANMQINMVGDGLFHALTWAATAIGLWMLFRTARRPEVNWSGKILIGSMIAGWGLFNFVEGVIAHHILHVHHVVERLGVSIWDWLFLGSGIVFIALGLWMIGSARLAGAKL